MRDVAALVYVVDDDSSARDGVARLIRSAGLLTKTFASGEEFLASDHRQQVDCLILDVRLPGMSGVELHHHLLASRFNVPVIFITGNGFDDRTRSETDSDWTVAYFRKPYCGDELLDAVDAALKWKPGS